MKRLEFIKNLGIGIAGTAASIFLVKTHKRNQEGPWPKRYNKEDLEKMEYGTFSGGFYGEGELQSKPIHYSYYAD